MPRPPRPITPGLIVEAARLHYKSHLSKKRVSELMGTSERHVSELLDEALERKIVRVLIAESEEAQLQKQIESKHPKLKLRVFVAPGPDISVEEQFDDLFRRFGSIAADFFEETHGEHPRNRPFHVGVTGGVRVLEFANAVPVRTRNNVYIHTTALIGRSRTAESTSEVEPSVAASILWTHCGSNTGRCEYETVEPYRIHESSDAKARRKVAAALKRLERLPSIEAVIKGMDNLDIAFAGFGCVTDDKSSLAMRHRLGMAHLLQPVVSLGKLVEEGAAGDFNYCVYDKNGETPTDGKWDFFLTAGHYSEHRGVAFYKRMVDSGKKVVGFGGGLHLLPALRAALKGGFVNVLILDAPTARKLADED